MAGVTQLLPQVSGAIPGPRSREFAARLRAVESAALAPATPPIVWEHALGVNVYDADGNRYVDLLAGFGVAALGYSDPTVTRAIAEQAARLSHSLSDVYPATARVELLERLDALAPGDIGSAMLATSGASAVECALKTALRVTGKPGVIAFERAYHGLGLGALDTTHAAMFREPFSGRLPGATTFVRYGDAGAVRDAALDGNMGAILVEPVQARGGVRVPPRDFLRDLRTIANEFDLLLIADEVYTGLGRTGHWFECEAEAVVPDLIVIGKALGGGLPLSACLGRRGVMERWGEPEQEALHTHTHLGNPIACAAACAVLDRLESQKLPARAALVGARWLEQLREELLGLRCVRDVRGRGLLIGIELDTPERAEQAVRRALGAGWILIQEGVDGRVLSLTPPLNIDESLLDAANVMLAELLAQ